MVCKTITVEEVVVQPNISVTGFDVYIDSTPVTEWYEDEPFWIHVDLENTGGDGEAKVQITYGGEFIHEFTTTVLAGQTTGYNTPSLGTLPPGTWDLCAEVLLQYPA